MQPKKTPLVRIDRRASNLSGAASGGASQLSANTPGLKNITLSNQMIQKDKSNPILQKKESTVKEIFEPDEMINNLEIQETMEQFNNKFDLFTNSILDEIDRVKKEDIPDQFKQLKLDFDDQLKILEAKLKSNSKGYTDKAIKTFKDVQSKQVSINKGLEQLTQFVNNLATQFKNLT